MTNIQNIIQELEEQRATIESALAALRGLGTATPERRGPGRPPGKRGPGRPAKKQGHISEEGRKRIAEAQRQRWAAKKKGTKKAAGKRARVKKATRKVALG